jgi:hypothetical protein
MEYVLYIGPGRRRADESPGDHLKTRALNEVVLGAKYPFRHNSFILHPFSFIA